MGAIDKKTLGAAKSYVKKSLLGGGAVVGKNVVIQSITSIDGGNRVTFGYTLDDGTPQTSTLDVMDGVDGKDGSEITPEQIQEAVNDYLEENPVEAGATEEQAAQIEANKEEIEQIQEDLGDCIKADDFPSYDEAYALLESESEVNNNATRV